MSNFKVGDRVKVSRVADGKIRGGGVTIKLRLKQIFCRHHYELVAKNSIISEWAFQCKKCGFYRVRHMGIGCKYTSHERPTGLGWED